MTEQFAIAVIGIVVTLYLFDRKMTAAALAKIADKLDVISQSIGSFVTAAQCKNDMSAHCEKLTDLDEKIQDVEKEIVKLKGLHNFYDAK